MGSHLPVYVFIHGGAYVEGTASDAGIGGDNLYDGRALAERERVIVVTLNYRLGLAGFFSHAAQASDPSAGSYGLLDQIAALSWVRANIAAFGGDPAHVTVAGESAGSESVCNLLVSPAAEPLIAGAIMESAPCNAGTRAQRDLLGASIASAAGCAGAADPMACLRAKPLDQLLRTLTDGGGTVDGSDLTKGPIAGTPELPEAPWHALHAGRHAKVPVLIGSNEWEVPPLAVSVDTIVAAARPFGLDITAEDVETVVASYLALRPDLTRDEALAAVATDAVFTCPARRIADSLAGEHARPAYRYQFAHGPSLLGIEAPAIHGMELLYVFGAYKGLPAFTIGPVDDAVAAQIDDAFGNFARSGAPPWWQFWGPADPTVDNAFVFDGWWSSQRNAIATADCQILAPWLDQLMPL
jgi:para-nitrobenzyl esterase